MMGGHTEHVRPSRSVQQCGICLQEYPDALVSVTRAFSVTGSPDILTKVIVLLLEYNVAVHAAQIQLYNLSSEEGTSNQSAVSALIFEVSAMFLCPKQGTSKMT